MHANQKVRPTDVSDAMMCQSLSSCNRVDAHGLVGDEHVACMDGLIRDFILAGTMPFWVVTVLDEFIPLLLFVLEVGVIELEAALIP